MVEDPADFGTFGRYVETPTEEMPPDMCSACEYTRQLRGMVPGPHKDPAGQSRAAEGDCADRILLPDGLVAVEGGRRDRHGPLAAACANESTRRSLVQPWVVPVSLYRRAKETIGEEGIVDMTVLMGWFTSVSLTLAAVDVPSNVVVLKQ